MSEVAHIRGTLNCVSDVCCKPVEAGGPRPRAVLAELGFELGRINRKRFRSPGQVFSWQKWSLFGGAVAHIAGHLLLMASGTN